MRLRKKAAVDKIIHQPIAHPEWLDDAVKALKDTLQLYQEGGNNFEIAKTQGG